MNKIFFQLSLMVLMLSMLLSSCEVVGGIFKAGMWTAFIIIAVLIALVIWIVTRIRRR